LLSNGNYDFDNPEALDIIRFQQDLLALLEGKEVDIPSYNFKSGESMPHSGIKLRLYPGDILIVEGIHALNPAITGFIKNLKIGMAKIPQVRLFINAPENLRLPRRLVRDLATRGKPPIETIKQWPTVHDGEKNYIYPTKENADVIIDTDVGESFYQSDLYNLFCPALLQALRDAEELRNAAGNDPKKLEYAYELIKRIHDYIGIYRIMIPAEELMLPLP
ncbi:MAG: hypothetical protein NTZ48_04025, partial [Candidatus Omnitrophica bacterium]|nr:hypothetical protein [Candidatus Omnitrophota bacterium]